MTEEIPLEIIKDRLEADGYSGLYCESSGHSATDQGAYLAGQLHRRQGCVSPGPGQELFSAIQVTAGAGNAVLYTWFD